MIFGIRSPWLMESESFRSQLLRYAEHYYGYNQSTLCFTYTKISTVYKILLCINIWFVWVQCEEKKMSPTFWNVDLCGNLEIWNFCTSKLGLCRLWKNDECWIALFGNKRVDYKLTSALILGVESDLNEGGFDAHKYILTRYKPDSTNMPLQNRWFCL